MGKIIKIRNALLSATTLLSLISLNSVYAADNASALFGIILDIVSKIFLAVGAFLGIMGIVHYAIANSDGDGPAKRKATMEMASGVAVIIVSIILLSSKASIVSIIAT